MHHLYVDEIDFTQVIIHSVDLCFVLQYGAGRLCQMIQTSVAFQQLGEWACSSFLTIN